MRSWKVLGLALLAAAVLMLGTDSSSSVAQTKGKGKKQPPAAIDSQGVPPEFHKGEHTGFFIWHGAKGWHLRTTTRAKEHRFHGTITVEGGTFLHVHPHDLEKGGRLADHWKLGPKKHTLTFDFKTDRGVDGIDFHVAKDATAIHFRLHFNGKHQREHIFIGHNGVNPPSDPFTLVAHPKKKKVGCDEDDD
ncbi:MAG TPA: hypothetical protein VEL76_17770 [Gemmataceae bacterium]|nr:hypothetical protein [Gemmataceae bacterium]